MTVFAIPGHGAGDPGACAFGYSEAERVRALATRMKEIGGSGVELADFSRNYYADGGVSSLGIPSDWRVVELHMDSAGAGACGGHVIVQGSLSPDEWDVALADFIAGFFPGRAQRLVGRTDLANPNRAASAGVNYRLVECGFISNQGDLDKFNSEIDDLARGILAALGVGEEGGMKPADVWEYRYGDSDNCFNALHNASREVLRRDDPTGRGIAMTTHEHVKWIAAELVSAIDRQKEMEERQRGIEAMLAEVVALLKEGGGGKAA